VPLAITAFPPGFRRGVVARFDLLGVNIPVGVQFLSDFSNETPSGNQLLKVMLPKEPDAALSDFVENWPGRNYDVRGT